LKLFFEYRTCKKLCLFQLAFSKSKVKVNLSERALRLPASPSLIIFQFHSLGFAFRHSAGTCYHVVYARHLALKGLSKIPTKISIKGITFLPDTLHINLLI